MDLDKLKALAQAASPGPWRVEFTDDTWHLRFPFAGHRDHAVQDKHDCDFQAAARQAVPELIEEVERLRALVIDLEGDPDEAREVTPEDWAAWNRKMLEAARQKL